MASIARERLRAASWPWQRWPAPWCKWHAASLQRAVAFRICQQLQDAGGRQISLDAPGRELRAARIHLVRAELGGRGRVAGRAQQQGGRGRERRHACAREAQRWCAGFSYCFAQFANLNFKLRILQLQCSAETQSTGCNNNRSVSISISPISRLFRDMTSYRY